MGGGVVYIGFLSSTHLGKLRVSCCRWGLLQNAQGKVPAPLSSGICNTQGPNA